MNMQKSPRPPKEFLYEKCALNDAEKWVQKNPNGFVATLTLVYENGFTFYRNIYRLRGN